MQNNLFKPLQDEALQLLKKLILTPSFSKEEHQTAEIIDNFFKSKNIPTHRTKNNVWAINKYANLSKPTLLLNSHHDTVKPSKQYTNNPFNPIINDDKLFGLGSNDAGGCLVALIMCFVYFYNNKNLPYNLIFVGSAEEEISGAHGIESVLPQLPKIDLGIVGEPTEMQMAVAEKGLLVLDVVAIGKSGHAARDEGINAFYKLLPDIEWFKQYKFEKISTLLGAVKMSITSIETLNKAHNVVPSECSMVVDIRVNELYSFDDILDIIKQHTINVITPRSVRLRSTSIPINHPLTQSGIALGKNYFGSLTTSDKALMYFPTIKIGPGNSARSHTADEFIFIHELFQGVQDYIMLLEHFFLFKTN
ncbi:MAG: M20 family metallo-hydrolase [Alphaproteobacteria bacterium]|nr:M20 family metallo-hydrolase [Alphaproteobacteria bacterium]